MANLSKSRGWLIGGGILSLLVGFLAMSFPVFFSFVIAQVLGAFAMASGLISLFLAIFGKHVTHRVLSMFSSLVRIVAGGFLLFYVHAGVDVITLILASFFLVEGVFCIIGSLKMRQHTGWFWLLLNGFVAILLGGMVYLHWPTDSDWVLGLLYGINSIFSGTATLMLGLAAPKEA